MRRFGSPNSHSAANLSRLLSRHRNCSALNVGSRSQEFLMPAKARFRLEMVVRPAERQSIPVPTGPGALARLLQALTLLRFAEDATHQTTELLQRSHLRPH